MRTLDRYIARSFLEPFFLALGVIVGLYMTADAFGNLDEFIQEAGTIGQALSRMARIYSLRLPTFIKQVLPAAMLVGAAYGISQLAGKNELMAMRACGISLWRVLAPLYTIAVVIALLGLANCEFVIPRTEQMTVADLQKWTMNEKAKLVMIDIPEEQTLFTLRYNITRQEATEFSVTNKETGEHYQASEAHYEGGMWRLIDVRTTDKSIPEMELVTALTPELIALEFLEPDVAPLPALRNMIERDGDNSTYRLAYHSRLAYPFTGIVLVALGLPFVIGNERIRRSRMLGIGLCLAICATFYTVQFVANDLGITGNLPPAVAAWLPTIIFGALSLYLLDSVET